jgi:hypothetical protein
MFITAESFFHDFCAIKNINLNEISKTIKNTLENRCSSSSSLLQANKSITGIGSGFGERKL